MSPVVIGQKPTFLVVVSYTFAGQKFERSTLFLNRPTEQVRFRLVSQAQDFDELERAFIGSLFSIDKM